MEALRKRKERVKFRVLQGDVTGGRAAVGRVALICVVWAVVHSLLASRPAKDLVARTAGPRSRDGVYRLLYNAQSLATVALATGQILRLPDRELYRARPPWSWLLRAGQAGSLGVLFSGVRVVGVLEFAGILPLWRTLTGSESRPETEAQGPPLGADGEMQQSGAFRFTRHPGNLGAMGFFLLWPRMTVNRATLAALVALYVVLGSKHEEHRLRMAYGAAFERYRRKVSFLIPRPPKD
jgi:protein-S-isoprenylcysteine O-methyltransferase Ste14